MRVPPKRKTSWTTEEEEALKAGVDKHGTGQWKKILKDPEFGHSLAARSNVDLAGHYRIRGKAPKEKWTAEEEEALEAGVKKYGTGKWKDIRNDPEFSHSLAARYNIDLKVKWRMMLWPKGKAAALEPALIAIPNAPASIFQSPAPDGKSALRYHSKILEAPSNNDDPSGADIGAINNFIEKQGEKKRDTEKERMEARRQKWTAEEEEALKAGINKYGAGNWKKIKKDPEFGQCLAARSNVDLSNHYRWQFRKQATLKKAPKEKWTAKELEALSAGVKKYGTGKWTDIQKDPEFCHSLAARSNNNLKVKWKMILLRKGKAAALEPALIAIPNAPASIFQSPAPDGKSALRYHSKILEAPSNNDDPSVADIGAINNFIEKQGEKKRDTEKERMEARRQKWTAEEEEALKAGVKKYGIGKWENILEDPEFCQCLAARSNIELTVHYHSREKETPSKKGRMRAPPKKWTAEELEALKAGANKYGTGRWKKIKTDPEFGHFLAARSYTDLKLKWSYMHWPEVKVNTTENMYGNPWTDTEDIILSDYIKKNGEGGWSNLPTKAGLKRCGEGCRQRWLNFLRPDIKRGNISSDEEELIIKLHKLLGNSWSSIATRLPGRTGYEIKNYWITTLAKKIQGHSTSSSNRKSSIQSKKKKRKVSGTPVKTRTLSEFVENRDKIRGSTDHCKEMEFESRNGFLGCPLRGRNLPQNYEMDCNHGENCCFSEFSQLWNFSAEKADDFLSPSSDGCSLFLDEMLQIRTGNDVPSDIQSLADVLGSEEADWLEE